MEAERTRFANAESQTSRGTSPGSVNLARLTFDSISTVMILAAMRLFPACSLLFASELVALCAMPAEPAGLFVAVGYGGRRISSRDAVNWENDQRWSDT